MSTPTFTIGENVAIVTYARFGDVDRTVRATVTKVLKTRVVVEYTTEGGKTYTRRFVIPTYGDQFAEEGYVNDYYHRVFLVKDDEKLAERVARQEAERAKRNIESVAIAAVSTNTLFWSGRLQVEAAEKAIVALQAFVASHKEV